MEQSRWKSPALYASIISFIVLMLNLSGIVAIDNTTLDAIINSILSLLIIFGIVNNPTSKTTL